MRRIVCIFLMVLLVIFACVSCAGKDVSKADNLPSKFNGDIIVLADNCNYHFYKDLSAGNFILFDILSKEEINVDDIKIQIDVATPYTYNINPKESDDFEYYIFQCYNNTDWSKMYNLYINNSEEYEQYQKLFEKEYIALKQENIIDIYIYEVCINFEIKGDMESEEINEINISYGNEEIQINIGEIILDYSGWLKECTNYLQMESIAISDKALKPSSDGIIVLDEFKFYTYAKINLQSIEILETNSSIEKVNISIVTENESVDVLWDGQSDFEIEANSQVTIRAEVKDERYKNKNQYSCSKHMVLNYILNGNECTEVQENTFRIRKNAYEFYAELIDGVDIMSFYCEYYNKCYK